MGVYLDQKNKKAVLRHLEKSIDVTDSLVADYESRVFDLDKAEILIREFKEQISKSSDILKKWNNAKELEFREKLFDTLNRVYNSSVEEYFETFRNGETPMSICLSVYTLLDYLKGRNSNFEWFRGELLHLSSNRDYLTYLNIPKEPQCDSQWARDLKVRLKRKITFLKQEKFHTVQTDRIKEMKQVFTDTTLKEYVTEMKLKINKEAKDL
ncbi:MAG: hypothetical protein CES88_02025 [Halobacteriovorax sp. JY17]|nr:MAG: hypothetical protein CES88_02025 [Halobacteriovorax sp. JY17]